mgnify:FL=1|tara:strand:- start:865 stop:1161 length:297 start_codon:yes stop_codon:yes gene_type:complete
MEAYGTTIAVSAQAITLLMFTVLGFFLRRLVSQVDMVEHRAIKLTLRIDREISSVREDVVRLEANSSNYGASLTEVKSKLDALSENIQWIREKLAGKS